ncbi:MAG: glycosyltransferase family 2 protein [Pseudomonadota bacterium]
MLLYLSMTDHRPRSPQDEALLKDNDLPIITILCPLYKEELGLPGLIEALLALDYPHHKLDIKIILEEKDAGTIRLAHKLCAQAPFDMVVVPDGPLKTKPKACNYALWSALGELLVIYDAEDRPEPGQLRLAASTFAKLPKKVVCLQARLNYYNREETWLTRLFAIEYALLFDLVLPGLDRLGAPLPLGGTSNIFRTQCLLDLGGWDPYNVTEDADLGLRMARAGFTTQMLDSTTYEEATSKTGPWIRQRSRWIKGYLQTTLVHTRRLREKQPWQYYLTLYFLVGGVVLAALANPIFWGMYLLWLLGWGDFLEPLFPPPVSGLATFTFLAGNLLHIWLFMIAPMRRHWHDLVPYALLAPLYWGLQSWAGYKALFQFLIRPFYWEKTSHGPGQSSEAVMAKAMPQTPSIGEP